MSGLWNLSWRNLWRRRRRSLLTVAVVALAVFFSLLYSGLVGAASNGLYVNVTGAAGHLVLSAGHASRADFRETLIPGAAALTDRLRVAAPDARIVTVLSVPALISGPHRSRGVPISGRDDLTVPPEGLTLAAGRLPALREADTVALGQALATALGVHLGDAVTVAAPGTAGRGSGRYRVVGLLTAADAGAEGRWAALPLVAAQALAAPDAATRVEVHLPHLTHLSDDPLVQATQRRLAPLVPAGTVLQTWQQANPSLAQVLVLLHPVTLIVSGLFFILAGLLVVNTVYLGLLERTREFGVIIALGAGPGQVTRMVMLESLLLCSVGALCGLLPGLGLMAATARGLPTAALTQGISLGLPAVLYPSVSPGDVAFTLGAAILTGLLAAWWPGRAASRLEPVEAMRFT